MPTSSQPQRCTCFGLRRLSRAVSRLYDQHLAAAGMRTTQYSLLRHVAAEPLPISVLARKLAMERTTLTRNLRPLSAAGWIAVCHGSDPRQRIVTITAAGREAIERAQEAWREAQRQLEEALGGDAVRDLHRRIDSALARLGPLLKDA